MSDTLDVNPSKHTGMEQASFVFQTILTKGFGTFGTIAGATWFFGYLAKAGLFGFIAPTTLFIIGSVALITGGLLAIGYVGYTIYDESKKVDTLDKKLDSRTKSIKAEQENTIKDLFALYKAASDINAFEQGVQNALKEKIKAELKKLYEQNNKSIEEFISSIIDMRPDKTEKELNVLFIQKNNDVDDFINELAATLATSSNISQDAKNAYNLFSNRHASQSTLNPQQVTSLRKYNPQIQSLFATINKASLKPKPKPQSLVKTTLFSVGAGILTALGLGTSAFALTAHIVGATTLAAVAGPIGIGILAGITVLGVLAAGTYYYLQQRSEARRQKLEELKIIKNDYEAFKTNVAKEASVNRGQQFTNSPAQILSRLSANPPSNQPTAPVSTTHTAAKTEASQPSSPISIKPIQKEKEDIDERPDETEGDASKKGLGHW